MSILLQNLTKRYGAQTAVNSISLQAGKGEIVGFLGPNGAGKSTTMKMITGYLTPDDGVASVCGLSVVHYPLETRRRIGYLPESNPLYTDMYVREYLDFVASVYGLSLRRNRIEEVLDLVGLLPEAHKKTGHLSKGYKQRVGLAAAILHQPEVLILDEPTSGLDPNQIVEIRQLIKELGREKTVLLSTHIMQEVEAVCDRVVIIHQGAIVADDLLENLHQDRSNRLLKVSFEEPLEDQWLQRLPALQRLEKINGHQWVLHSDNIDALRRQVLQLANEQHLNIINLQTGGGSLESIFRQLTGSGQPAANNEAEKTLRNQ